MPIVDVAETPEELVMTAELPGLTPKDINVRVENGVLTLYGEKKETKEEADKERRYHMFERYYGEFRRTFTLPRALSRWLRSSRPSVPRSVIEEVSRQTFLSFSDRLLDRRSAHCVHAQDQDLARSIEGGARDGYDLMERSRGATPVPVARHPQRVAIDAPFRNSR